MKRLTLIIFLMVVVTFTNSGLLHAQKKVIKKDSYKIRLIYKKNQLKAFRYTDLRESFFKRQSNIQTYNFTWKAGELEILSRNASCSGYVNYKFRYDSLFRIYEATMLSEWSNHSVYKCLVKKFKESDLIPYRCYYSYKLNYPHEQEVSYDCDKKFDYLDIVEYELNSRKEYYNRGPKVIEYSYFALDEKDYIEFIYDLKLN